MGSGLRTGPDTVSNQSMLAAGINLLQSLSLLLNGVATIIKTSIIFKLVFTFNTTPVKILMGCFKLTE